MQTVRSKRSRKIKGKSHSPSNIPKLAKVPLRKSPKILIEVSRDEVERILKDFHQTPKKPLSTPVKSSSEKKKRKSPIERLRSDLSPKYIGFSSCDGKRSRYGRQQRYEETEDFLLTNIACCRTPSKLRTITSPGPVFEQKFVSYESPIEKLIQKNKILANMASPQEDSSNSVNEPAVNDAESHVAEKGLKTQEKSKTRKLMKQVQETEKEIVATQTSTVIASQAVLDVQLNSQKEEKEANIENTTSTVNAPPQGILPVAIKSQFNLQNEDKAGLVAIPNSTVNISSQAIFPVSQNTPLNLQKEEISKTPTPVLSVATNEPLNLKEDKEATSSAPNPAYLPVITQLPVDLEEENKDAILEIRTSISSSSHAVLPIATKLSLNYQNKNKQVILTTPTPLLKDTPQAILDNVTKSSEKINKEASPKLETISSSINLKSNIESNSKTVLSYDFIDYHKSLKMGENNTSIRQMNKSPSANSTDSAKGSSIDTDIEPASKAGTLFWARISSYPYWPCIVWPDPQGRTIRMVGKFQEVRIHVRFFADNGRRSWVRQIDMFPYNGRIDFDRRMQETFSKYHKKHMQYRAFVINDKKKPIWEYAISEADIILSVPIGDRFSKFNSILEDTRKKTLVERQHRRQSLNESRISAKYYSGMSDDAFSIFSEPMNYFSDLKKRERSPTPESPAYEDIDVFVKRRKIDLNDVQNTTKSLEDLSSLHSVETENNIIEDDEFKRLYELMKSYTMINNNEILEKQLYQNVKEIWIIRKLTQKELKDTSLNSFLSTSEMNIRRLSSRMRTLTKKDLLLNADDSTGGGQIEKKLKRKRLTKPIEEVVEDIMNLNKNYLFRGLTREPVCKVCYKPTNLIKCTGSCQSWVHQACINITADDSVECSEAIHVTGDLDENLQIISVRNSIVSEQTEPVLCNECRSGGEQKCFVCKNNDPILGERFKCHINLCCKFFHIACLKYWPQTKVIKSSTKIESLLCPSHICHTCVSDDPRGKFLQLEKLKLAKCIECPATYHLDSLCIPAGTQFLTATRVICPRHRTDDEKNINANWCFICTKGGSLMCCDTCPTAFHLECLKMPQPEGHYICEECETGRLPLYGEMVWAKLGVYRWWPAIIIPPPEIPKNLMNIKHNESDFCIRFFGSNDHSWISRRRVFLYQEGDWGFAVQSKRIDNTYKNALVEAKRIFELIKTKKHAQKNDDREKRLRPLPYTKIKINRPVPPVKLQEVDISELTACDCNPSDLNPCGPNSGCLNRLLLTECNPKICPVGTQCQNQMFEKRLYPPLKVSRTKGKGWGLVCEKNLISGDFIIEYVGEVIDLAEFKVRIAQKQEEKDENYYFLTLEKDYMIDAGPKGNLARFMNHSCEPNCDTQKWNVNGVTRVGLFAIKDIPENTELTFNYNLACIGNDKKVCHCGADKCAGFIGAKYKEKEEVIPKTRRSGPKKPNSKGVRKKSRKVLKNKLPAANQQLKTLTSSLGK